MRHILLALLSLLCIPQAYAGGYKHVYNAFSGLPDYVGSQASSDIGIVCDSASYLQTTGAGTWGCVRNVGVGTTVPAATLDVSGNAHIGSSTSYASIDTDGTLSFVGNATVYDDLQVTLNSATALSAPTITTKYGSRLYTFSDEAVNEDQLPFTAQLPHGYKVGSPIEAHVHYTGEDNTSCNFVWGLEYRWTNYGSPVLATSDIAVVVSSNNAVTDYHNIADFPSITIATRDISSIVTGTLYRNSTNAMDTCNAKSAYLLAFDIHYEIDQAGSRTEYGK
jgi:hypothetical protein